jgi:DNA-binding PadR family transcriptional regulator
MRDLTELEGCVLAYVWEKGSCTAYVLRQEFLRSPSPHWSGSAGAIYPLVQRLARERLLRSENRSTGRRRSKCYALTPAGLAQFLRWLGPPLTDKTAGLPMDPLRTRLRFLGALSAKQRAAFLANAEAKLVRDLVRLEKEYEDPPEGPYDALAGRGAVAMMRARLEWIRQVSAELGGKSGR